LPKTVQLVGTIYCMILETSPPKNCDHVSKLHTVICA
jgi:hypothetical protein